MGTRARVKPKRLAKKLRAIRRHLQLSQSEMAALLKLDKDSGACRVSEYETGKKEASLITLLHYANAVKITINQLADDKVKLQL